MALRNIIEINRDLCNGCGACLDACAEGALVLDDEGKAVLAKEIYCDGLGACLDVCPTDALKVVQRESEDYDAKATFDHVLNTRGQDAAAQVHGIPQAAPSAHAANPHPAAHRGMGGCPGSMAREIVHNDAPPSNGSATVSGRSELSQWPIQLHLVSPYAPYFNESDLLIAADCTAFSFGSFHQDFLKGKKLVIACPKLDETSNYVNKLTELLKNNTIYSVTVAIMQVPCCAGLAHMVDQAVENSGLNINVKKVIVGVDGSILN